MNRKYISLLSLVAMFAIVGGMLTIDNVTAKEDPFHRINHTVVMEDIFNMKAGETRDLPLEIVNLDKTRTSVNIYVTEQGNEPFKSEQDLAFTSSIDVTISESSMNLDAVSSVNESVKSPMSVSVSIPTDTESGMYSYSLIVQETGDSHQYIKYFYINVE